MLQGAPWRRQTKRNTTVRYGRGQAGNQAVSGSGTRIFVQSNVQAYPGYDSGTSARGGLPELSWLPLVESGFSTRAFLRHGLLVCGSSSHQRDTSLAWRASFATTNGYESPLWRRSAYLTELHIIFGDWNFFGPCGLWYEGRVLRVISQQRINYLDNFWDLYRRFPNTSYVPGFSPP